MGENGDGGLGNGGMGGRMDMGRPCLDIIINSVQLYLFPTHHTTVSVLFPFLL